MSRWLRAAAPVKIRGSGGSSSGGHVKQFGRIKHLGWAGLVVGLVIGLAIGGTMSWATIPDGVHGQITGCYRVSGANKGALRVIDYQAGDRCVAGTEHMLKWDRKSLR